MTIGREPPNDIALEALLAEARSARPPPLPEGLQARLLADAAVAQTGQRLPAERPGRLSALRGWLADLGGLPGMAGLSAAGVAGLWIGLAEPLPGSQFAALIWEGAAGVSPSLAGLLDQPAASPFDHFVLPD